MIPSTGSVLHNAPRVSYPVGRSSFYAGLLGTVWLTGVALVLVWAVQSDGLNLRHVAISLLLFALGSFAAWSWHQSVQGVLIWDGQCWAWISLQATEPIPVALECHLDLQVRVLLYVRALDGSLGHWVWWERHQNPVRWMDARRALFSHVRRPAPQAADHVRLMA